MRVASRVRGIELSGSYDERFAPVADAFAENFADGLEGGGSACAVLVDGRPVVDIWAGSADPSTDAPWRADTLELLFSATKGVVVGAILMLTERGLLDLDAPVSRYWPEFGAEGKADIPVRWILAHRSGIAVLEGEHTLDDVCDPAHVARQLASQAPAWPPGTDHGYHVRTFGWILGEIVRRITGRSLGRFVRDEIAGPLGLDLILGLPEAEEHRVARIIPPAPPADAALQEAVANLYTPDTLAGSATVGPSNLFTSFEVWNDPRLHRTEIPSSNGFGTARALAGYYAALIGPVEGGRLVRAETLEDACRVQSRGPDVILGQDVVIGTGFWRPPYLNPAAGAEAFGHPGVGGCVGLANASTGLAFAYVTNRMIVGHAYDPRADALLRAVTAAMP